MARLATNFWNSLVRGRHLDQATKVVGEDIFGNRYYEIPADPSRGKRRGRRWFTNEGSKYHDPRDHTNIQGFDSEIPSEWDSWLRFRRDMPPTEQQILQSYALAELKKKNAADLERKRIEELKAEGRYVGPPNLWIMRKPFFQNMMNMKYFLEKINLIDKRDE